MSVDLRSLGAALDARPVSKSHGGAFEPHNAALEGLERRLSGSESVAELAVLLAVKEAVAARNLSPSPTSVFAGLCAALPGAARDPAALRPSLNLLLRVLALVPRAVLSSRCPSLEAQLCSLYEELKSGVAGSTAGLKGGDPLSSDGAAMEDGSEDEEELQLLADDLPSARPAPATSDPAPSHARSLLRCVLQCLARLLAAHDPADWAGASRACHLLLGALADGQPALRSAAACGTTAAFASWCERLGSASPAPPLLTGAAQSLLQLSQLLLARPEQAARAAAAAPARARAAAEAAIVAASGGALALMRALRGALDALPGGAAGPAALKSALFSLFNLLPLRNALLSKEAYRTICALCLSPSAMRAAPRPDASLPEAALRHLLRAADASLLAPASDADLRISVARDDAVAELLRALSAAASPAASALLPAALAALLPALLAQRAEERERALARLVGVLDACVGRAAWDAGACAGAARALVAALRSAPEDAGLDCVCKAAQALFLALERAGGSDALPGLGRAVAPLLGELERLHLQVDADVQALAREEDAREQRRLGGGPSDGCSATASTSALAERVAAAAGEAGEADPRAAALRDTLAEAVLALGPDAVLAALPLDLERGLAGQVPGRPWMLPILRDAVRGASLRGWLTELLPLAQRLGALAARTPVAQDAAVCAALGSQVWEVLPAYARWAPDGGEAWARASEGLLRALEAPGAARGAVCEALRRLATQCRLALKETGGEVPGWADPCLTLEAEFGAVEEEEEDGGEEAREEDGGEEAREEEEGGSEEHEGGHGRGHGHGHACGRGCGHDHHHRHDHDDHQHDGPEQRPPSYTREVAERTAEALRGVADQWLPRLLNASLAAPPAERAVLERALSALACVCGEREAGRAFKAAAAALVKLFQGPSADPERAAALLHACLCLGGGLDARALRTLARLARQAALAPAPGLQKKGYRALAYVCEARPDFSGRREGADALLQTLREGAAAAAGAAKRHRLRCLRWAVLELVDRGAEEEVAAKGAGRGAGQLSLPRCVGELVLALKEANAKTRRAAHDILKDLALELDSRCEEADAGEDSAPLAPGAAVLARLGPVQVLLRALLGGLAASTPHAQAAAVSGLTLAVRCLKRSLAPLLPALVRPVLALLRSPAREVVRAALGFARVSVQRLPPAELEALLPDMLTGALVWAEDARSHARRDVQALVERACLRLGSEAVQRAFPEQHARLLASVRKNLRRRAAGGKAAASQASELSRRFKGDWDQGTLASYGRLVERDAKAGAAKKATSVRSARTARSDRKTAAEGAWEAAFSAHHVAQDPEDLTDPRARARLAKAASHGARKDGAPDSESEEENARVRRSFGTDDRGRMVVRDAEAEAQRKRRRTSDAFDSDDSDFEDLQGLHGIDLALEHSTNARNAAAMGAQLARSRAGGSARGGRAGSVKGRGRRAAGSVKSQGGRRDVEHSGERFRSKGKGGGDVKKGGVEPYAYWPLDRRMLNRRESKARGAKAGLSKIVHAAKDGAAKGRKAKRQRAA